MQRLVSEVFNLRVSKSLSTNKMISMACIYLSFYKIYIVKYMKCINDVGSF